MKTIGLFGCGRWGRNILRDLESLGCNVFVVEVDHKAIAWAHDNGVVAFHSDDAWPEADGYIVATTTVSHADIIASLQPLNKPIFVEKPLCTQVDRARQLLEANNQNIFVMEKWRYHGGIQAMKDLARSGKLGGIQGLRTTRVQWNQPHHDVDSVWILAPHDLSIAKEILGEVPPLRAAFAEGVREPGEGLIASFGDDPWFVMEVSSLQPVTRREIRVVGERGIALLDDPLSDHIKLIPRSDLSAPPDFEMIPVDTTMPLLLELKGFVEYLDGGPEPKTNLAEAVENVELITAIRQHAGLS
jgi:predicted dehydrogenase